LVGHAGAHQGDVRHEHRRIRAPQDGRISLHLQGRYIDFRVAAQPTTYGENVVLRILDKVQSLVALDALDWRRINSKRCS